MNERTSAVITPITGGMFTVKNGASSFVLPTVSREAPFWIMDGKNVAPVKYERRPERTVDPYAIATVIRSIFPAVFPMSDMAGVTSPRMIRGMANPRNWLKIPLKVSMVLTIHGWAISPTPIPSAIAIRILPKRPIFSFFMWLTNLLSVKTIVF